MFRIISFFCSSLLFYLRFAFYSLLFILIALFIPFSFFDWLLCNLWSRFNFLYLFRNLFNFLLSLLLYFFRFLSCFLLGFLGNRLRFNRILFLLSYFFFRFLNLLINLSNLFFSLFDDGIFLSLLFRFRFLHFFYLDDIFLGWLLAFAFLFFYFLLWCLFLLFSCFFFSWLFRDRIFLGGLLFARFIGCFFCFTRLIFIDLHSFNLHFLLIILFLLRRRTIFGRASIIRRLI